MYNYAEARKKLHKAKKKKKKEMKSVALSTLDSFTPDNVYEHDIGSMESICAKCGVLMFHDEMHKKAKQFA